MDAIRLVVAVALVSVAAQATARPLGKLFPFARHAKTCAERPARGFARCHAHVLVDDLGNPLARKPKPPKGPPPPPPGFGPADLRSAYNVTGNGSANVLIAIVDAYGYVSAERDLKAYRAQFGLPLCTTANGCFTKVNQSGLPKKFPRANKGWAQETALDLDMASAMCPSCRLLLVEANSASYDDLAAATRTAAALGAQVISNSYGGDEAGSESYESSYSYTGVAVTASTGDDGYGVSFPASSPHVIAVGGTSLERDSSGRGWSELAWAGAGSGCSTIYAKPVWQLDLGCSMRTIADVSAIADPETGVAVYGPITNSRSGWMVFGGTSAAAPIIAGVYGVNGGNVTYASEPYANAGALFDVVEGSNGNCGGSYLCTGLPGYDGPTGLGTPNGASAF